MRAVQDQHVDRPDVDARQRVQLTGPNRSIALEQPTDPHSPTHIQMSENRGQGSEPDPAALVPDPCNLSSDLLRLLRRPGGHGEGAPPDPIPNSTVKPLSADGTAS